MIHAKTATEISNRYKHNVLNANIKNTLSEIEKGITEESKKGGKLLTYNVNNIDKLILDEVISVLLEFGYIIDKREIIDATGNGKLYVIWT